MSEGNVDLLYLAHNRLAFTKESLSALRGNTNWALVGRLVLYDDSSIDGTREVLEDYAKECRAPVMFRCGEYGGPIAVMNDYLKQHTQASMFAKVDNDVILPPHWLELALSVMCRNPRLDILGLEAQDVPQDEPAGFCEAAAIGGVGLMRRSVFTDPMSPVATHGGFDRWQFAHPEVKKGWLSPSLPMFLIDRLPMEPWASLSDKYIGNGWQRPWKKYTERDAHLWGWWEPIYE